MDKKLFLLGASEVIKTLFCCFKLDQSEKNDDCNEENEKNGDCDYENEQL